MTMHDATAHAVEGLYDYLDLVGKAGTRHPVVRTGPREPLDRQLRLAVIRRDDYFCQICKRDLKERPEWQEVDHIIPWSTGGSDHSTNLRLLCMWCNQARSNFTGPLDIDKIGRVGIVMACLRCTGFEAEDDEIERVWCMLGRHHSVDLIGRTL